MFPTLFPRARDLSTESLMPSFLHKLEKGFHSIVLKEFVFKNLSSNDFKVLVSLSSVL